MMPLEEKSEVNYDRLSFDLATVRLLHSPMPDVEEKIRSELMTIRDVLVSTFPDSAVVLGGSLLVGEGQVSVISGRPVMLSDCDLFVVSRNMRLMWPAAARRLLASTLGIMPLSFHLDINLIWEPLARKKMTTFGGAVIGGSLDISEVISSISAPAAGSTLFKAYRYLTAAPLYPQLYEYLCAKSLMLGAKALLLQEMRGQPHREWMKLSSLVFVRDAIRGEEVRIGTDAVDVIQHSCDFILGAASGGFSERNYPQYVSILGNIAKLIPMTSSRKMILKHAFWLLRERRLGIPYASIGSTTLLGLKTLAESWDSGRINNDRVHKAELLAWRLCRVRRADINSDPMTAYVGLRDLFANIASFNPHTISFGPRGISV